MKRIHHIELRESHGMINLTEFQIEEEFQNVADLLDFFVRSQHYLVESSTDFDGLGTPLNTVNIFENDFRRFDKIGLRNFLEDYRDNEDWESDRESFANLVKRFYELYPSFAQQQFYVINYECFFDKDKPGKSLDNTDPRINYNTGWWCYKFFLLIIWIDPDKNSITVTEWFND